MKTCIIFNPAARGEKARRFLKSLEGLQSHFVLRPTHCAGAARQLATQAAAEGYETIVAAGGDGTLNEVLNGIADAPDGFGRVRLAVLPLGTINVFARELKLPVKMSEISKLLEKKREITLDVGLAEFSGREGSEKRFFLQLAGAGVDARSVELVSWQLKKKVGRFAYLMAGFKAISSKQPRITISNGVERATGDLVLIGNGRLYGGDFPIFHKSDLQDGVLDAVVFDKVNWRSLPTIGWDLVLGRLFKEGRTGYLQGRELQFTSDSRAALQLDGEFAGELPARLTVLPRALRVLVP